jgi:uncharacterized RDD family membrane protein YckC
MSYGDDPVSNPYAAPASKIVEESADDTSRYVGYASFGRRFLAYLIDYFLMFAIGIAMLLVAAPLMVSAENEKASLTYQIVLNIVSVALSVAYYAGMESSASQATLGKMAMGLKVTDLYGRRISLGRAVGRLFGKVISGLIFLIGFLMVIWTEKKQGLHDMMAGTLVLETR